MKVAITGSSGLLGRALCQRFTEEGHTVFRMVRSNRELAPDTIYWNPARQEIEGGQLAGMDAVVHLAGETVDGRWCAAKKQRIRDSRVDATRFLAETLAQLPKPPQTLVCASAIGFYGTTRSEVLNESSPLGGGFLAEVVRDWEAALAPLEGNSIRQVQFRIGVVLDPEGGALSKLLLPFRLGVGGPIGDGSQMMSWVSKRDAVEAFFAAATEERYQGLYNLVSPNPVSNHEFAKVLAKVLNRPALFPVPAPALKLVFGQMAEETILSSLQVEPQRLREAGFAFRDPDLAMALRSMLNLKPEAAEAPAFKDAFQSKSTGSTST